MGLVVSRAPPSSLKECDWDFEFIFINVPPLSMAFQGHAGWLIINRQSLNSSGGGKGGGLALRKDSQ